LSFSGDWLALREPYDAAARDLGLARALASWAVRDEPPLGIVDLGSGTGANLRWLAPHLGAAQIWRLVEHDRALIALGESRLSAGPPATYVEADLARQLGELFESRPDIVTGSALIDLVSESWLLELVRHTRAARAALLIALTYDGRIAFQPGHALDEQVVRLVNTHQANDKGFGRALGPRAGATLARLWAGSGAEVRTAASDWRLGPADGVIQTALVEGYAAAAAEVAPAAAAEIEAWRWARLAWVASGQAYLEVGHTDVLGLPPV
jgi:hypothetical protein